MTYDSYRTAAHESYTHYPLVENPDEAQRTSFSHTVCRANIPERVPYTELAPGICAMDIQDFISWYPEQAASYLEVIAPQAWKKRQVYAYSAAYASRTFVIYIAAGIRLSEPLDLQALLTTMHKGDTHDAYSVILAPHARATIIDRYHITQGNHIKTTIYQVGEKAQLSMVYDHQCTGQAQVSNAYLFHCDHTSTVTATYCMQSDIALNIWFDIQLAATGADAKIRGIYALSGNANARIITEQYHTAPDTTSLITLNGCLTGKSKAQYNGRIHLDTKSQGAIAQQRNHTLLVSETAQAVSTPSLEALAHQVHCVHASAVGTLDPAAMTYLCMRGLPEAQARKLLLQGFIQASLDTTCASFDTTIERVCALF